MKSINDKITDVDNYILETPHICNDKELHSSIYELFLYNCEKRIMNIMILEYKMIESVIDKEVR